MMIGEQICATGKVLDILHTVQESVANEVQQALCEEAIEIIRKLQDRIAEDGRQITHELRNSTSSKPQL